MDTKVVLLHGFTDEEARAVMGAVKSLVLPAGSVAFAMSTPTNVGWRVGELLAHVSEEHRLWTEKGSSGRMA
jgi:hypothetical protein